MKKFKRRLSEGFLRLNFSASSGTSRETTPSPSQPTPPRPKSLVRERGRERRGEGEREGEREREWVKQRSSSYFPLLFSQGLSPPNNALSSRSRSQRSSFSTSTLPLTTVAPTFVGKPPNRAFGSTGSLIKRRYSEVKSICRYDHMCVAMRC